MKQTEKKKKKKKIVSSLDFFFFVKVKCFQQPVICMWLHFMMMHFIWNTSPKQTFGEHCLFTDVTRLFWLQLSNISFVKDFVCGMMIV